ncbi:MAG: COG4280 domain-containing protein [Rubrobacteraceae bacterium]
MSGTLLLLTSFLASAVEAVEALTVVLAVGITRGWRTSLTGVALALVALAVVVAALGPALVLYVPLDALRVLVGALLLIFGLQWLRKAILRASGLKALRDEERAFQSDVARLSGGAGKRKTIDRTGFVLSFKGVFLEGLEVAFIVITFGASSGQLGLSATGALLAVGLVALVGVAVHRPLSRVPENVIKFAVGLMLTAFGTFWGGEGVGIEWAIGDAAIPLLVVFYGVVAALMVAVIKARGASNKPLERKA